MKGFLVRGHEKGRSYVMELDTGEVMTFRRGEYEGLKAMVETMYHHLMQAGAFHDTLLEEYRKALRWFADNVAALPRVDKGDRGGGAVKQEYWTGKADEFARRLAEDCARTMMLLDDAKRAARSAEERRIIQSMKADLKYILDKLPFEVEFDGRPKLKVGKDFGAYDQLMRTPPGYDGEVSDPVADSMPGLKAKVPYYIQSAGGVTTDIPPDSMRPKVKPVVKMPDGKVLELTKERLYKAAGLTELETEVFKMRANGVSKEAIAEMLKTTRGNVDNLRRRAAEKIKRFLDVFED